MGKTICEFTGRECDTKGTNPDCLADWIEEIDPKIRCIAIGCNHLGQNVPCPHDCPVKVRSYAHLSVGAGNEIGQMKPYELHGK